MHTEREKQWRPKQDDHVFNTSTEIPFRQETFSGEAETWSATGRF